MNRKITFVANGFYHVYNRGHHYQNVFHDQSDYLYFLKQLRRYKTSSRVAIVAYCLMPNHYHLLVQQLSDRPLSVMMQAFGTSIAKTYNKKYRTVGALFQGPFRAKRVDRDEYLMHLVRYIHLNPAAAGLVANIIDWPYSNYPDMLGLRKGTLCDAEPVLQYFDWSPAAYQEFVESYQESDLRQIRHLLFAESEV